MPVVTRKAVFLAVKAKFPLPKQRTALSQKLGKKWSYASTDALAQAVGLQRTPRKSAAKGTNRAKATTKQHGFARSFASENAAKNLSDNETKRALIKGRLVRSVKHAMTAKEKAIGRKLTPQEKKAVAAKAFSSEVKAIKAGQPESKPKRGGNQKPSTMHTPPPGVSVAEHKAALRRQYGASSGSRTEQLARREERRADVGRGENGASDRRREVADRVRESKGKKTRWEDYKGNQPWQAERNQYGQSGAAIAKPIQDEIHRKIESHPEFAALKQKIDRSNVAIYGKGKVPAQTAENYICHTEYNSKSAKSQEINAAQRRILKDLQIASPPDRVMRGNRIDWHKAAVQKAVEEGQAVPSRVLESFGLSRPTATPDDIPFGNSTTASKPAAKHLDGKLNSEQKTTIAAHLRKVESGGASSVPLRALQDASGQHWLEMKSASGKVGAVPIDAKGKKDNDRALHSDEWKAKSQGMSTIARFPAGKEVAKTPTVTSGTRNTTPWAGDKAPLQGRKRAEMVRGRSID